MFINNSSIKFLSIDEIASNSFRSYVQSALAPVSKQLIDTDNSLINTQV